MNDEPVKRGKAFNSFLGSLLQTGGLEAHTDQRGLDGRDEIDVAFSFEQRHFILEAKWLAEKVNDDALEKLRGRLKVRLPGTIGFFVSMSGYTQYALDKAKFFTGVLLLDRSHIEALVTGLLTAPDLVSRILSWANRRGGSYPPLDELLSAPADDAGNWSPPEAAPDVVQQATGVSAAAVLAAQPGTALTGMTTYGGNLLLTTGDGVLRLDPATGEVRWVLSLPGSRDSALQTAAGTAVLCGAAVVTTTGSTGITPVAGPFPNLARLLTSPAGELWVFATTGPPGYGGRHTVTRVAARPAEQWEHSIDFVGKIDDMALLPDNRLYLVGGSRAGVLGIREAMAFPEQDWERAAPLSEVSALLPWGAHKVLSAGRASGGTAVQVYSTDLRTHEHTLLATVLGQRAVGLAHGKDDIVSLIVDAWLPRSALPRPVLISLAIPDSAE
ncbi:restriction endonuclease [Streptomyces sp. GbtcB6]|uniref:restriction endonuclease n=1 Tax=Streptomyces sp. GbtcB6 TaxID=2824751 RepID=UPI001C2FDEBB|nr:restriction endonuclease [Streptomyces sp. GbtcB6]